MKSRLKQLSKDSAVYGLGGVAARAVGFFLLPVYTRLFSPAEYGTIEMLVVLNNFLISILVMGLDSAQSFYFFEQKRDGQQAQAKVVSSILQWHITCGAGIVFMATLLSPLLNHIFFQGQITWEYFALAFSGGLFAQVMSQSAEVFRLLYRPWNYISINLGQSISSAAIAIALIVVLDMGIIGFLIGILSGSILAAIFGWWGIRSYLDFSEWHRFWWPRLLRFGAPLVPAGIGMYVLTTADRWFINYYHGQEALGLYAIGAKFAMIVAIAVTTFRQAWWPIAMDAMQSEDGPLFFRSIARLYMGLGSASMVVLTVLSPFLVRWFTTPDYFDAYPIVGILAWHSIFYGFFLIGAAGIWKAEKTVWVTVFMGVAAFLNIGLDALLVPTYACMGAAVATSVSFLVWNILSISVSERLWNVGYRFPVLALQVIMGGAVCCLILRMQNNAEPMLLAALVSAIAILALLLLSLTRENLQRVYRLVVREI